MLSRRALLVSTLAAAAVRPATAGAQTAPPPGSAESTSPATILQLQRRTIDVNGKPASVFAIRQPYGTSGIVTEVGKRFRVHLENSIDRPSLIHWHGLTPPWQQDGVPGISGPPIPPSGSADYDFPLRFGGTFWMHSHQGLQEQSLMLAPLIIHDDRDRPGERWTAKKMALARDRSKRPAHVVHLPATPMSSIRSSSGSATASRGSGVCPASLVAK